MKILLLSAYHTASHKYWCEILQARMPQHHWTFLSLPPRYFSWRIRGNALSWVFQKNKTLQQKFDVVLATSMTDLNSLIGLLPHLGTAKKIYYFHENQFAYPVSAEQKHSVEPQMVSLYGALCADKIAFNSQYNCDTFLAGVDQLLKKLPDHVPPNLSQTLREKAQVLPVPIVEPQLVEQDTGALRNKPFTVVWNHRWEYDKGVDRLLQLINVLPPSTKMCWHIIGQQFRQQPQEFTQIYNLLEQRNWLGHWGFIESKQEYFSLLAHTDVALSTAYHDFQGLAILEACQSGCIPLTPKALAYPEWFKDACLYDANDVSNAVKKLIEFIDATEKGQLKNYDLI